MSGTAHRFTTGLKKGIQSVLIAAVAVLLALGVGCLIIMMFGKEPSMAFKAIYAGSLGSKQAIGETLVKAAPLLLTAMAFAVTFRCGLLNIGAEGQIYVGGMASMVVAQTVQGLPFAVHMPLCVIAGMLFGGLWGALAGWLKVRFNADEMITTIMLNYIGTQLANFVVTDVIRDPAGLLPQSKPAPETARLTQFVSGTRIHIGVIFAVLCLVFYYIYFSKMQAGFRTRVVGMNKDAAEFAGINRKKYVVQVMFIAGVFSGLAGASEILGLQIRMLQNFSPGYGFDGIAVAMLGNNTPIGMLISALMFGALKAGSNMMQIVVQVPMATVSVVQGLVILFVVGSRFLAAQAEKRSRRKRQEVENHG